MRKSNLKKELRQVNKKKFLQTDSPWGSLGYPYAPCYVRNCGCGMVSIANIIIEMEKYNDFTPSTIQPYCKQYAAPGCDGTYFSGIPRMMEHYGLTEVQEHNTMSSLWKELAKGNRVAIYLMGSRNGGSKGVHWTSGGHFVCSVAYKHEDGLHKVYVKDSYSNSPFRNGWISYEGNMRNDVVRVWSGKLPKKEEIKIYKYRPSKPYKGKLPKGVVKLGDDGEDAKRLQEFLNWCVGSKLNCKGHCRKNTIKALKRWQKTYGITTDGVWGSLCKKKAEQIIEKYADKEPEYYSEATKIGHACCNEKGGLHGGKPGDQTEHEVQITDWSKGYGWLKVYRHKDPAVRLKIAQYTIDACENENIGYNVDKPNRYAAWDNAEKNGHDIKGISKEGDTTCTQLVSMVLRAVGTPKKYAPRFCDVATATRVMPKNPDLMELTGKAYTSCPDNLEPGDFLLSAEHMAVVVKSPNAK